MSMTVLGQTTIFCFVAWMEKYRGPKTDTPVWDSRPAIDGWVAKNGYFLAESYNFRPLKNKGGGRSVLGHVQARFDIKKLGGGGKDFAGPVTVVWCAADPREGNAVKVVGWYRNAKINRGWEQLLTRIPRQELLKVDADERDFIIEAAEKDTRLLRADLRPRLPVTPGLSKIGRWHAQSKTWKGDGSDKLARFVEACLKRDWQNASVEKIHGKPNKVKRRRVLTIIRERQGQAEFRNGLLIAYQQCCAVTGCRASDVLDACHIYPASAKNSVNSVENGILLRTDLHTLFDLGYLAIDPDTRKIWVSSKLKGTEYHAKYHDRSIGRPIAGYPHPDSGYLRWHWRTVKAKT